MKKWEVIFRPMLVIGDPVRVTIGPVLANDAESAQRIAHACLANGAVWAVDHVVEVMPV